MQRRDAEAAEALARYLRLEPADAPRQRLLGALRESLGDLEGAARAYRRALALDPADLHSRARLNALRTPP